MIIGKCPRERAKELAKENKIETIEMEIEDWAEDCNELKLKIEKATNELSIADSKRVLWCWTKEEKLKS